MKPLTKHQLDTYESAFDLAQRGLLFMPRDIAGRKACIVLAKRRMLEVTTAVYEESDTGNEGRAYRLGLRPAFANVVRMFNAVGYRHMVKVKVRAWRSTVIDEHTLQWTLGFADVDACGIAYLALWHALSATIARAADDEPRCIAHLITVRALAGKLGVP